MATQKIDYVVKCEIGMDENDWAIYKYRVDGLVEDGATIEQIVEAGKQKKIKGDVSNPHSKNKSPERFLDIRAKKSLKGVCLYLFAIDYLVTEDRLQFVPGEPFIPLTLNSAGDPKTFLKYVPVDGGKEKYWAAFSCNIDDVRKSNLAQQIGKPDHRKELHEHPGFLNIPFSFNVIDPELKASPWAVPGHSDEEDGPPLMTHGGVHPSALAFLSVEL